MTPEEREILRRVAMLSEENNALLRKSLRRGRIGAFVRFLYWVIIIGISVATYYYLQPYMQNLMALYTTASSEINSAKGL